MPKLFIDRRPSDNKYLHRDFHLGFDQSLQYLGSKYNDSAVDEFLDIFARKFYLPLINDIKKTGFAALRKHITDIYETEEAPDALRFFETESELKVSLSVCPAVSYMRSSGHIPSKYFVKGTSAVNRAIAEEASLGFEMLSYNDQTGAAEYRFFRL